MGPESLYCSKWIKISKLCHDFDLGPTMPNIELVLDIFIYYNALKFHVPRLISIVAFRKNAPIMRNMQFGLHSNGISACTKSTTEEATRPGLAGLAEDHDKGNYQLKALMRYFQISVKDNW